MEFKEYIAQSRETLRSGTSINIIKDLWNNYEEPLKEVKINDEP